MFHSFANFVLIPSCSTLQFNSKYNDFFLDPNTQKFQKNTIY